MDEQAPNYHREFLKSPHHAALGLLTLGVGFLSGDAPARSSPGRPPTRWAGFTCPTCRSSAAGWTAAAKRAKRAEEAQKVAEFVQRRDALLRSLSPERRERYTRLAAVCRDIETASADNLLASADPATDPRLRKLDELMWTYLRLLGIEESLEQFLETERSENVPAVLKEAEAEAARLNAEVEALKAKGNSAALDTKQRYLGSRLERLEVLRKRQQRSEQAEANLALVRLRAGAPRPADQAHPRRRRRHQERRDPHRPHRRHRRAPGPDQQVALRNGRVQGPGRRHAAHRTARRLRDAAGAAAAPPVPASPSIRVAASSANPDRISANEQTA